MRRIGALTAITALLIWSAPGAQAEPPPPPGPPGGAVADAPTLSLADLGATSTPSVFITRDITRTTLMFPVPPGLAPVLLRTALELPVNFRSGELTVSQGDRTLSRLPLPPREKPDMEIPLAGALITDNWVTLTLTVSALPLEECWDPVAPAEIRFTNGSVTFAGSEIAPATIAAFLPPVLRRVTIGLPATPSRPEAEAALQVVAAVANRSGQRPDVVLLPLPDGATTFLNPSVPLERQIIVKEGPQKGVSLQGGPGVPSLLISGPADQIAGQARLLADDSLRLAAGPTSVANTLPDQQLLPDTTTLEQVRGSGLTSEAMWPTVGIDIDQTRWGHPVGGVSVHLKGSYTPLPVSTGGEVIAAIGGEAIERWPVDAAGTIDRTVTIPDRMLRRFTVLDVSIRTIDNFGRCGEHMPILLRVDAGTTISVRPANPPMPQGFQSLPQALMPKVRIGISDDVFADTVRAAQILVGLQRESGTPVLTEVSTLAQAAASTDPAILIAAGGWDDKNIALPFTADQGRLTVTGLDAQGQSVSLNVDPAPPFGSLQTVLDGQRTVLIATSTGAPGQLDELLGYLAGKPGGWAGLDGRAIISVPGMEPITVSNPRRDYSAAPKAQNESKQEGGWFWWVAGGVAAVAALGAVAILLRARKQA